MHYMYTSSTDCAILVFRQASMNTMNIQACVGSLHHKYVLRNLINKIENMKHQVHVELQLLYCTV